MKERIIKNSAKCRQCKQEIESKHIHDFVTCKCGSIHVDGGHAYLHWGAKDLMDIIDTSITEIE